MASKKRTFNIYNKDYYDGEILYKANKLTLQANNVYCLVGCNGIGKSTIIRQMIYDHNKSLSKTAYDLKNDYDNFYNFAKSVYGKKDKTEYNEFYISIDKDTNLHIKEHDTIMHELFGNFMSTGEQNVHNIVPNLPKIIESLNKLEKLENKDLYVMIDDLDVGVSIDVLIELAKIIDKLELKLKKLNVNYYIVITANSYELARRFKCIDVINMKEISFKDYDDYANYVSETRKYKDIRNKKEVVENEEKI